MRTLIGVFLASSFLLTFAGCETEGAGPTVVEVRAKPKVACGGFAGITCPEKLTCVDDPSDDCDPALGGADCIGMCVNGRLHARRAGDKGKSCNKSDPSKSYVAESLEECAVIRFICAEGSEYFADSCGCGCQEI